MFFFYSHISWRKDWYIVWPLLNYYWSHFILYLSMPLFHTPPHFTLILQFFCSFIFLFLSLLLLILFYFIFFLGCLLFSSSFLISSFHASHPWLLSLYLQTHQFQRNILNGSNWEGSTRINVGWWQKLDHNFQEVETQVFLSFREEWKTYIHQSQSLPAQIPCDESFTAFNFLFSFFTKEIRWCFIFQLDEYLVIPPKKIFASF